MTLSREQEIREKILTEAICAIPTTTVHGSKLVAKAMRNGWINDTTETSADWMSSSNIMNKKIVIGVGHMSDSDKARLVFGESSQEEMLKHRIIHELGHFVLGLGYLYHDSSVEELMQHTMGIRKQSGYRRGLTGIGSDSFYDTRPNPEYTKPNEDATDLLAEYVRNPKILENHLSYLSNPQASDEHDRLNLTTITPATAADIYDAVEGVVKRHIT